MVSKNMDKKMNAAIIIAIVIVAAAGLLVWNGGRNKTSAPSAPAVDSHGHPIVSRATAVPLDEMINKLAPDFSLADRNGKTYSSNELRGKNIVLFFNEGLMCYPACWNQIVELAQDERFNDAATVVLSVVVDQPEEWQSAIEKMPDLSKATVVFDKGTAVSKRFGMLTTASSMHYGLFPGHTYVVIDKKGVVRHIFDDPNMSLHNDQLAAELSKLN